MFNSIKRVSAKNDLFKLLSKDFVAMNAELETEATDFIAKFMEIVLNDDLKYGFSKYETEKCLACLNQTEFGSGNMLSEKGVR